MPIGVPSLNLLFVISLTEVISYEAPGRPRKRNIKLMTMQWGRASGTPSQTQALQDNGT